MSSVLDQLAPTRRFSNRVDNYVSYRPSYPEAVVPFMEKEFGLQASSRIADIGSGTGLFAEPLLKKGYTVVCIEPNDEMRSAGEKKLGQYPGFTTRRHTAEQTGLRTHSIDLVTVAQAFHWMDPVLTKKEFERITKPGGHIVLAWNIRRSDTPFLQAYDRLKEGYRTEQNAMARSSDTVLREFFSPAGMNVEIFDNVQWLDFDGLKGQLLSSSYIPLPGEAQYETMIDSLVQIFVEHNRNGFVKMEYDTKLYWGRI